MNIQLKLARPTRSLIASSLVILASAASFLTFSAAPALAAASCPAQANPALPNCRAYELVSPPHKNGALLGGLFARHPPPVVAENGATVIAPSDQCFAGPESCVAYRLTEGEPYEFKRTSSGWVTHPLAPPASEFETDSYWSVNATAGTALFSSPGFPEGPDDFYGRQADGSFVRVSGPFGELVAGNGTQQANASDISAGGVLATADLSHIVYETTRALSLFDQSKHSSLYEYAGANSPTPLMVGVEGGPASHELISACRTLLGAAGQALSEDGRTVYFTALSRTSGGCPEGVAPPVTGLYARVDGELPDAHTVLISGRAATGCETTVCIENATEEGNLREPGFEGASNDGSRVFFTDTQQLTDGASESAGSAFGGCHTIAEPGGCNLYESVCAEPCGTPAEAPNPKARELIDLSEGAKEEGGPRVQGVMAVSADGTHVYFVAQGVLTGNQENQEHEKAENEKDNLYLYTAGHVTFIARLSPSAEQQKQWAFQSNMIANVTPDGEFLVFTDSRALTADDTRPEGEKAAQVFEYDAATGALRRISIGEKGYDDNGNGETGNAFIVGARRGGSVDESVPGRRDPSMSDDGQLVFFESPVALAPGALEDVPIGEGKLAENIYEYYKGQVYLISGGKDITPTSFVAEGESRSPTELLGVGASGANVIFSTFDQLTREDGDTQRDYYDAHVCSETEPCIEHSEPVPCQGEACQGTPSTLPVFGVPGGTATASAEGNLASPAPVSPAKVVVKKVTKCRKGFVKNKKGKCIKKKAKKAMRASRDRRASR